MMNCKELSLKIRRDILRMTHDAKSSHVGSCLSCADILAVLYGGVMKYHPSNPQWQGRDRFILGKGHACVALYATLAECGFFPIDELKTFYQNGGLEGHASHRVKGVEVSTGSLGMALSIGCGMAMADKNRKVFVLLGEGDCDEGSTWEAAMFAAHHELDNLVVVIDKNGLQALGKTSEVLSLGLLPEKWRSFGWVSVGIDGHDLKEIEDSLKSSPFLKYHPTCIVACTVKGKGVSWMENKLEWHYKCPNDDELVKALEEIR